MFGFTHGWSLQIEIEGYRMVFASMRAVRLFLRARLVIKYVLRAASTLKSTDGEQRALRKFSRRNLDFSLLKRNVLRHAIWLLPLNPAAYSQLCLVGDDFKLHHLASPSAVH